MRTNEKGVLIIHQSTEESFILGAGRSIGKDIDDFEWEDIWKIKRENGKAGLYIEKPDSISGLISWNGTEYVWSSPQE